MLMAHAARLDSTVSDASNSGDNDRKDTETLKGTEIDPLLGSGGSQVRGDQLLGNVAWESWR